MRQEGGFGVVTVMIGAVVLGIFALTYTQQMQNRANVSLIGDLMAFREQVMTYYSSVASNRSSWECTIRNNAGLERYLATGHKDSTYTGPGSAGQSPPDYETLNIYDYTGGCQEGFGGAGGNAIIPVGLRFDKDHSSLPVSPHRACDTSASGTHFCLKAEWSRLDPDQSSQRAVEVRITMEANRTAIKNDFDVSFELANKEYYIYFNRTVATDCSDGRVTGYFPGTARGSARPIDSFTGTTSTAPHTTSKGVPAYAGDTAVVKFDSVTGMVACWPKGPLVVPPCYDMSDYKYIDPKGDHSPLRNTYRNPFISGSQARGGSGMPGFRGFQSMDGFEGLANPAGSPLGLQCDGSGDCCPYPGSGCTGAACSPGAAKASIPGRCPITSGSGTTAIAYFDPETGISQCSNPNILVEKTKELGRGADELCEDANNQFGVVLIRGQDVGVKLVGTFQCSTDVWGSGRGGVEPEDDASKGYPCSDKEAIGRPPPPSPGNSFTSIGKVSSCVKGKGLQTDAPKGFPGPKGERGLSYPGPAGPRPVSKCLTGYSECSSHPGGTDTSCAPGLTNNTANLCDP